MTYFIFQSDKVDTNCFRCNPIRTLKCFWKLITVNFTILSFARKPIQLSRKQVRYFCWSESNNTQLNIQELVYTLHENTQCIKIKLCFQHNCICHTYNRCQLINRNFWIAKNLQKTRKIFNWKKFEILSITSEWCNS